MPRQKKETAPKKESVAKKEVAPKKENVSKKEVAPKKEAVVSKEVVATKTENVVEDSADLSSDFGSILTRINEITTAMSSLKSELKTLEKRALKELKNSQKLNAKRKRKSGNRAPSGFVKPTKISEELTKFLNKEPGTEMARTEVTREINAYIRAHNLQDKSNGRQINADTALSKLLKLKKDDVLTYFNLQKFMSPHFAKSTPKAPVSVPSN